MEKNARKTGIIVKIQYGRGRHGETVHNPAHQARQTARSRNGTTTRTRLSIVIKAKPGKSHMEDE